MRVSPSIAPGASAVTVDVARLRGGTDRLDGVLGQNHSRALEANGSPGVVMRGSQSEILEAQHGLEQVVCPIEVRAVGDDLIRKPLRSGRFLKLCECEEENTRRRLPDLERVEARTTIRYDGAHLHPNDP